MSNYRPDVDDGEPRHLYPATQDALLPLAKRCQEIVEAARAKLGYDLCGYSVLDLVADQIPDEPLSNLRGALVVAGYRQA